MKVMWGVLGSIIPHPWVGYQPVWGGAEVFLFVSGMSKKTWCTGALTEAEILTSPSPMYLHQLGPGFGTGKCSAYGCVNTFQVV